MAENDLLKRLLDAGVAFTQMTQRRAEEIVNDLVHSGEVRTEQAQTMVQELVDRSRQNSERLLDQVRKDLGSQVAALGLATKAELDALRAEVTSLRAAAAGAPVKRTATKAATARPAKKAAAPSASGSGRARAAAPAPVKKATRATKATKKA